MLYCYKLKKINDYKVSAEKALDYLMSQEARPYGHTFFNRDYKNGDKCNGVMGQAWPIEALVYAFEVLEEKKYLDLALEVYYKHVFDKRIGLWKRCDIDGSVVRSFDTTLNHQMWFAASAGLLSVAANDEKIEKEVNIFLSKFSVMQALRKREGLLWLFVLMLCQS